MSKTYALLDVDNTLLNDNGTFNLNIVNSLIKNNIQDVYLFTDMRLQEPAISEYRHLIGNLQDLGLIVRGVLSTSDLFWGAHPNDLIALDACLAKNAICVNNITDEELEEIKKDCPNIALPLKEKRHQANVRLGAAFLQANIPDASEKSNGAKLAAEILSTQLPNRPHPKALLFKHFLEYKPADCTSCVIFEDREDVIKHTIAISQQSDVNISAIQVYKEDFQGATALQRYTEQLRLLQSQNHAQQLYP